MAPFLSKGRIFAPFRACTEALIGDREAALANIHPLRECTKGLTAVVLYAQAAVFLESRELAERMYQPLLQASSFGRFFGGTSGIFPMGSASRLLGELAHLRGDIERAREHFDSAIAESREMDSALFLRLAEEGRTRAGAPKSSATKPPAPPKTDVSLSREGDVWAVTSSIGRPFRVKHAKGMEYLDHLLQNAGREIYVLALGGAGEGPEDAGVVLDPRAKQQYKERVSDLEDQLDEAERMGDRGRASRARDELEALAEQLASSVGLGGRDRKAASNVARARVNVQRRLKAAIRSVAEHDAALGDYLEATVRTGTYCVYKPV